MRKDNIFILEFNGGLASNMIINAKKAADKALADWDEQSQSSQ
jgi:hypothetical protein